MCICWCCISLRNAIYRVRMDGEMCFIDLCICMEIWIDGLELTVNIVEWFWETRWPEMIWWFITLFWVLLAFYLPKLYNYFQRRLNFLTTEYAMLSNGTYKLNGKEIKWKTVFIWWNITSENVDYWVRDVTIQIIKKSTNQKICDCDLITYHSLWNWSDIPYWSHLRHKWYIWANETQRAILTFWIRKEHIEEIMNKEFNIFDKYKINIICNDMIKWKFLKRIKSFFNIWPKNPNVIEILEIKDQYIYYDKSKRE